ncbi:MAG: hypothetical protein HeimC3_46650 [Candidatus Heimdallarchaeota archaeon LC_3]|nr:MAG: hypothetical protein HeimC3_46650 [Candidatus Heimdallarchaeota archaeon LC_3]
MGDPLSRLKECRSIIFDALKDDITEITIDSSVYQLKVVFSIGSILYIRFNEFDEYGYQLIYTKKKGDFIRFDNFDDKWEIKSKPNHYHTRYNGEIIESPMIGVPSKDMQKLIKIIKKSLF